MVWKPTRILAAVDGSETGNRAARAAVDCARLTGGTVTLITVVRPPEGWWGIEGSPPSPEAMALAVTRARAEVLQPLVAEFADSGVEVATSEEIGDPATAIINACSDPQADALFVGRRGAGLLERMMMGSVADRLAHETPCPVVIVP